MLISHIKKFIYTKTIKTASTSVEAYFEKYCLPQNEYRLSHAREMYTGGEGVVGCRGSSEDCSGKLWKSHMSAVEIKEKLSDNLIWDDYFKFCVIRNPYDKMISLFYFQDKNRLQLHKADKIKSFRSWLSLQKKPIDRQMYMINGSICVDFFIKYERLDKDIEQVCTILDIPFDIDFLPKYKKGNRLNDFSIVEYYDTKSKNIVEKIYDFEIDYFDYRLKDD